MVGKVIELQHVKGILKGANYGDVLVVGGDMLDFDAISCFNRHKRNSVGLNKVLRDTRDEIVVGRNILDCQLVFSTFIYSFVNSIRVRNSCFNCIN